MNVRSTIVSEFEQVAREQDKHLATLSDDMMLLETGLELAVLRDRRGAARRHATGRSVPDGG